MNHPVLLDQPSSVRPDFAVYAARRARLMAQMGANSLALIPTSDAKVRNRDADYRFRPDSSMYKNKKKNK